MRLFKRISITIWCWILPFIFNTFLFGQDTNSIHQQISDVLSNAYQVYGPDEMLENGRLYIPDHPKAKGNPYLLDSEWMFTKLIVARDIFDSVQIKYNVNHEQIILKKGNLKQESHIPIILNNNFIDSFSAGDRYFVNLKTMPNIDDLNGFGELIYKGRIIFFIKHHKEFLTQYSQSNPYGVYSKLNSDYYIINNGKLTPLNTKGAFLKYFEPQKKEIKKYIRQNKIRYHKATSPQLNELIKYCDEISHSK